MSKYDLSKLQNIVSLIPMDPSENSQLWTTLQGFVMHRNTVRGLANDLANVSSSLLP